MGKLARERVEQELAWDYQESAYLGVYERVLGQARPASGRRSEMCGIAGCYQQADGQKLTDIMTVRIAHRGADAYGDGRPGDLFLARDPLGIRAGALDRLIPTSGRAGRTTQNRYGSC